MKWSHYLFSIFCTLGIFASAQQIEATTILQVTVTPTNYVVQWITFKPNIGFNKSKSVTYKTSLELTKALKNSAIAANVMLVPASDVQQRRLDETIAIIKGTGYKGKIGMVGNEVFN
jgi:hypothetical protein